MLKAVNLSKKYSGQEALKGINLDVQPGEVFCLLGANGAGKSTTIRIFLNFTCPSGGAAYVNQLDVQVYPEESKRHLAYIPEIVLLYPALTGLENLAFFSRLAGFDYERQQLEAYLRAA